MNTDDNLQPPAATTFPAAGAPAQADPLAIFATPSSEKAGVLIDVEHPTTGAVLMRWRIARFGGANAAAMIKAERQRKGRLPQGQRRQIDAGGGDPEVVQRLNRQVFIDVSVLGWEMVDETLRTTWGEYTPEKADAVLEKYPRMFDLISEKAVDEQTFAEDQLAEDLGNSRPG